jgi:hypothetical protein
LARAYKEGVYGQVYKAKFRGEDVAVKVFVITDQDRSEVPLYTLIFHHLTGVVYCWKMKFSCPKQRHAAVHRPSSGRRSSC